MCGMLVTDRVYLLLTGPLTLLPLRLDVDGSGAEAMTVLISSLLHLDDRYIVVGFPTHSTAQFK